VNAKSIISQKPKKIKNQLNHKNCTNNHPIISHITFAKFHNIFRGAAAALESISFRLNFLLYSLLYISEKLDWAKGITAAYQRLLINQNNNIIQKLLAIQNIAIDIHEASIQRLIIFDTHTFFESSIKNCCVANTGIINNQSNIYHVIICFV